MDGAEGWPAVSPADTWLARLVGLAEDEAAELIASVVDDVHVVLALSRPEAGSGPVLEAVDLDPRRLRDFVLYICGINEAHTAERERRAYRRTGKNRRQLDGPRRVAPEAARIIEEAQAEAEFNGAPVVGADHLIVALCRRSGPPGYFGLTAAEARRRCGLRPRPTRFAHLPDLVAAAGVRRPLGRGPLVLGGGGEEVMAAVFARSGRAQPRMVLVGAADRHGRAAGQARRECEAAGGVFVDAGIYRRADAADPAGCDAIGGADVVLLSGGRPEEFLDAVIGTPAHEALVEASDAGAIVIGSSAGAAVLGEAAVSDRITDDGFSRLTTLGWLAGVIVHTHWMGRADDDERVAGLYRSVLPGLDTLVVDQRAAVWVEPGWQHFRVIDRGDRSLGAHLVHGPDGTIEPLPDSPPGPPSGEPRGHDDNTEQQSH